VERWRGGEGGRWDEVKGREICRGVARERNAEEREQRKRHRGPFALPCSAYLVTYLNPSLAVFHYEAQAPKYQVLFGQLAQLFPHVIIDRKSRFSFCWHVGCSVHLHLVNFRGGSEPDLFEENLAHEAGLVTRARRGASPKWSPVLG